MGNKVKIIVDSTCDLSFDVLNERNIHVIPLTVILKGKEYKDKYEMDSTKLFDLVEQEGELPTTAAISMDAIITNFNPFLEEGYDIIYMGIGGKFSRSNQNVIMALEDLPPNKVFLVDSKNLSTGIGLLALIASDLRDQGFDASEIKQKLDEISSTIYTQFVIKTLDYMKKGGRATNFQASIGSALRIRPVLHVRNGELKVYKKAMGKLIKGIDIMLDDLLKEHKNNNLVYKYFFITHTLNDKGAEYILSFLEENNIKFEKVFNDYAGSVIASHCGEGTIGIIYQVKK